MIEISTEDNENLENIEHLEPELSPLDALQNDMIHQTLGKLDVKSEHNADLAEVKAEVEEQVDVIEERRDIIDEILPDLNDIVANNCLDELKRLHLSHGFVWDINEIKRLLQNSQKIFIEQKNGETENDLEDKKNKFQKFSEIFHSQLVDGLFEKFEEMDDLGVSDQEAFAMLVFLAGIYEELDEEKKKKLLLWIEEKIAFIKEGKLLEVYEIQIGDDGTITIKGSMGGQNVTIVYKPDGDSFDIGIC